MRIISATVGPLAAASSTAIINGASGTTTNTPLTLTASPYTLDFPRQIAINSAAVDFSGISFLVSGTDWNGTPVTEKLTGPTGGATVTSLYSYTTITSVVPSGTVSGTLNVGTSAIATSRPIFLDEWAFGPTAIQVNVSGTANATVRQSLDDPNSVGYTSVNWVNHPDTNLVSLSSTVQGNYAYLPKIVQLLLNSGGTGTSSVTIRVSQSAAVPL